MVESEKESSKVSRNFFPDQFMMAIIGSSKSGKTRGLLNEMARPTFPFRGDHIIVFSPTARLDQNFEDVRIPAIQIHEQIDLDLLEEKALGKEGWLFIFDDLIGDEQHLTNHSRLPFFVTRARHWNMSMIFLSQSFRRLPMLIRRNLDILVIHRIKEDDELNQVLSAMNQGVDKKIVKKMYDVALAENRHNNLTLNDKWVPNNGYFSKNYGEEIYSVKKSTHRTLI